MPRPHSSAPGCRSPGVTRVVRLVNPGQLPGPEPVRRLRAGCRKTTPMPELCPSEKVGADSASAGRRTTRGSYATVHRFHTLPFTATHRRETTATSVGGRRGRGPAVSPRHPPGSGEAGRARIPDRGRGGRGHRLTVRQRIVTDVTGRAWKEYGKSAIEIRLPVGGGTYAEFARERRPGGDYGSIVART